MEPWERTVEHDGSRARAAKRATCVPTRGDVLVHDMKDGALVTAATNQRLALVYADPRRVEDAAKTAGLLGELFGYDEERIEALEKRLGERGGPYEPIERHVDGATLARVHALALAGVKDVPEETRFYPESGLGGHVFGVLGADDDGKRAGKYGIEGYFDQELSGTMGFV